MFPECLSLHAVDRARAGICLGRPYVSSFIPPVSCVVSSVYALGREMESLVPGARVETVGNFSLLLWATAVSPGQRWRLRTCKGRTESIWSVPLGWVEFAGFTVCVFCLRGVLYQIHVHRLDLLPEINPLVSCRARFSFCPACAPLPTDQSLQSDYEMNGSGLFSL